MSSLLATWKRSPGWKPDARKFQRVTGSVVVAEIHPVEGGYQSTVTGDAVFPTIKAAMAAVVERER